MYPKNQSFNLYHDTIVQDQIALARASDEMTDKKEDNPFIGLKTSSSKSLRRSLHSIRFRIIAAIVSTIFTGLLVAIIVILTTQHRFPWPNFGSHKEQILFQEYETYPIVTHDCGDSPESAKAKGCLFDPMSFAWHHPVCYSSTAWQAAMDEWGPWIFYLDRNATQPIPGNLEALSKEVEVWTEHSYHLSHCLYAWRRNHAAGLGIDGNGGLLPREVANINHTGHCIGLLQDGVYGFSPGHTVNAYAAMVFDPCVRVR